jgi:DNA-directed RNA polymerase subunit RPC12/RpoP
MCKISNIICSNCYLDYMYYMKTDRLKCPKCGVEINIKRW